jgi:hypothetical protein
MIRTCCSFPCKVSHRRAMKKTQLSGTCIAEKYLCKKRILCRSASCRLTVLVFICKPPQDPHACRAASCPACQIRPAETAHLLKNKKWIRQDGRTQVFFGRIAGIEQDKYILVTLETGELHT